MEFDVDQVVYLSLRDKLAVLPVKIIEKIVRQTKDAVNTQYIISLPGKPDSRINLDKMNSVPFVNLIDAKRALLDNAERNIDKIIQDARTLTQEAYPEEVEPAKEEPVVSPKILEEVLVTEDKKTNNFKQDDIRVELPGGQIAKVSM